MTRDQKKRLADAGVSINHARAIIQEIADELQAAFDDRSERWQDGSAGEAAQEKLDELFELISQLENADETVDAL